MDDQEPEGEKMTTEDKSKGPIHESPFQRYLRKHGGSKNVILRTLGATGIALSGLLKVGCTKETAAVSTEPPITEITGEATIVGEQRPEKIDETAAAESLGTLEAELTETAKPSPSPSLEPSPSPSPTEIARDKIVEKYTPQRAGLIATDESGAVITVVNADDASYAQDKIHNITEAEQEPLDVIKEVTQLAHQMTMESILLHKELYPDFEHDDDMWVAEDGESYSFVTDKDEVIVVDTKMPIVYKLTDEIQLNSQGEPRTMVGGTTCGYSSENGSLVLIIQFGEGWPIYMNMSAPIVFLTRIQQVTGVEGWQGSGGVMRFTHDYIPDWHNRIANLGLLTLTLEELLSS